MNNRAVKIFPIVGLLIMNFTLMINNSQAQWIHDSLLPGKPGYLSSLAFYGNDIYYGDKNDGLYRSTNYGKSWTKVGFSGYEVASLSVSGNKLFASVYTQGIFFTTNDGLNWSSANNGLTSLQIRTIIVNGSDMYAGSDNNGGVFRSTNNGLNWFAVNNGITNLAINCIAANGSNIYAGTNTGVFISINNGLNWTSINSGLINTNVHCIAILGSYLFAGTNYQGTAPTGIRGSIYRSSNNGIDWFGNNTGITDSLNINNFAIIGSKIYVGRSSIYSSTNNGDLWVKSDSIGGTFFGVSNNKICTGYDINGIYYSTNSGTNWLRTNALLSNSVKSLAFSNSNLYAASYLGEVCKSSNNGINWSVANSGLTLKHSQALAVSGNNIYTGTEGDGIYLSTNDGTSWKPMNNGLTQQNINCLNIFVSNMFAGTTSGAFHSINNGSLWNSIGLIGRSINCFYASGTKVFAATDSGMYLSSNTGLSWTAVNNGLTNLNVLSVIIYGSNVFAGTKGNSVFKSTDDGATWISSSSGLIEPNVYCFEANGKNLFAGTSSIVFLSTDNGASWLQRREGIPGGSILHVGTMCMSPTYLFMGCFDFYEGIWRRPLSDFTGIQNISNEIPEKYSLSQNHPNPFNPTTKINYELRTTNYVTLKVFDISGKEITTLIDQRQNAGTYQVTFNSSEYNLPSGIYFYRMETGSFKDTKKMVIVK